MAGGLGVVRRKLGVVRRKLGVVRKFNVGVTPEHSMTFTFSATLALL
jgi:hypothetical protein